MQFDYVLASMVHPYYKFEFVKETFGNNVFPVSLDTIEYDGVIKPPTSIKHQPGRPRTKGFAVEVSSWIRKIRQ
jgi:hypothetical protein